MMKVSEIESFGCKHLLLKNSFCFSNTELYNIYSYTSKSQIKKSR